MITINENGKMVIVTEFTGEDWLIRMRSIIRLVQSSDKQMMSKDDIYNALALVEDMLPNEEQAINMFK